jgi:hypothetical protein
MTAQSASAQEIGLYGGWLKSSVGEPTYSWAVDYTEGFGKYVAGSITWLNEGHLPDHHRDGRRAMAFCRGSCRYRRRTGSRSTGRRATWNRVVTRYSRDTDVLLGGVGYRF